MQNEIVINADPGETRVALVERNQFTELHIERDADKNVVGNVVKGRVSRVLPGMQAAFVDIGLEKAAFLYVGDYFSSELERDGGAGDSAARRGRGRGRNGGRPSLPSIETVLHEGKEIVVQIAKEPIGTKGARITSNLSIAGRHLVLTPWAKRVGVSRRIGSDKERRRLRDIVSRLRPKDLGFIIRTAGDGVREADLEADIRYLANVWEQIQTRNAELPAPAVLHSEHDLALRIIRDLANHETKRIAVDNSEVFESIKTFVDDYVADPQPKIEHYEGKEPIFDHYGLEQQIQANLERKVWLKSGGSLIVDQSEALTAIDVNTGRFVGKRDLEETVLKTNLEAVKEVVHQLRFRNIGGLIILDLIDMESSQNREKVYRALQEALRSDKARTNVLKISELGLVEMTRKRTRENLVQTLCEPCSYCEGRGYVLSRESVAFKVLREIRKDAPRFGGRKIALTVSPQVAEQLFTTAKDQLAELAETLGREIEIRARPGLHQEQFEVISLDTGPPVDIPLRWLNDAHPDAQNRKGQRGGRGDRGREVAGQSAEPEVTSPEVGSSLALEVVGATATAPEADGGPLLEPAQPEAAAVESAEPSQQTEIGADGDGAAMTAASDSPRVEDDGAGDDTPEPVDVKAESRIIPRSDQDADRDPEQP